MEIITDSQHGANLKRDVKGNWLRGFNRKSVQSELFLFPKILLQWNTIVESDTQQRKMSSIMWFSELRTSACLNIATSTT